MKTALFVSLSALVGSAFFASGCATVSRGAADVLVPVDQEVKLGKEMVPELEKELTLSTNQPVIDYVNDLGAKVLKVAKRDVPEGITITFKLVEDDEQVNAFAIPGGGIYVYTGLLKAADNAAEVVAVLSHEVAHVTKRHVAQRLTAAYGLQSVSDFALGKEPGLVGQVVSAVVSNGALLKYSRDQERESDEVGIKYMNGARYDPNAMATFFAKLGDHPEWTAIVSSHPAPQERVKSAEERVKQIPSPATELGEAEHQAIKAQL